MSGALWRSIRSALGPFLAYGLLLGAAPALAKVAVVKRNLNLRVDPSTDQEPIRLLTPGTEAQILDNQQKVNGYYHGITPQCEGGWDSGRKIEVDPSRNLTTATPAVIFHGCAPEGTATTEWQKALNRLKDRHAAPQAANYDLNLTIAALILPGHATTRWNQGRAAEISGIVANADRIAPPPDFLPQSTPRGPSKIQDTRGKTDPASNRLDSQESRRLQPAKRPHPRETQESNT